MLATPFGKRKGGGLAPVINVTPLVDVVLVLLIIFMVVLPSMTDEGKPIEMVKVESADVLKDVTVGRKVHFMLKNVGGKPVVTQIHLI